MDQISDFDYSFIKVQIQIYKGTKDFTKVTKQFIKKSFCTFVQTLVNFVLKVPTLTSTRRFTDR